jgi:uncharacterized membrane protein YeiB
MRKIILVLILLFVWINVNIAADRDSSVTQQVELKISLDTKKDSAKVINEVCKTCNPEKVKKEEWILVLLPIILFLLFFYYFMGWLKRDKFKIADALTSCELITLTAQTKDLADNVVGSTSSEIMPKSSSRLIAFITALSAIVIALCLTSYYIFITLADCPNPDLDGLWKIIAALGIGIIPYGANMWKESKKDIN